MNTYMGKVSTWVTKKECAIDFTIGSKMCRAFLSIDNLYITPKNGEETKCIRKGQVQNQIVHFVAHYFNRVCNIHCYLIEYAWLHKKPKPAPLEGCQVTFSNSIILKCIKKTCEEISTEEKTVVGIASCGNRCPAVVVDKPAVSRKVHQPTTVGSDKGSAKRPQTFTGSGLVWMALAQGEGLFQINQNGGEAIIWFNMTHLSTTQCKDLKIKTFCKPFHFDAEALWVPNNIKLSAWYQAKCLWCSGSKRPNSGNYEPIQVWQSQSNITKILKEYVELVSKTGIINKEKILDFSFNHLTQMVKSGSVCELTRDSKSNLQSTVLVTTHNSEVPGATHHNAQSTVATHNSEVPGATHHNAQSTVATHNSEVPGATHHNAQSTVATHNSEVPSTSLTTPSTLKENKDSTKAIANQPNCINEDTCVKKPETVLHDIQTASKDHLLGFLKATRKKEDVFINILLYDNPRSDKLFYLERKFKFSIQFKLAHRKKVLGLLNKQKPSNVTLPKYLYMAEGYIMTQPLHGVWLLQCQDGVVACFIDDWFTAETKLGATVIFDAYRDTELNIYIATCVWEKEKPSVTDLCKNLGYFAWEPLLDTSQVYLGSVVQVDLPSTAFVSLENYMLTVIVASSVFGSGSHVILEHVEVGQAVAVSVRDTLSHPYYYATSCLLRDTLSHPYYYATSCLLRDTLSHPYYYATSCLLKGVMAVKAYSKDHVKSFFINKLPESQKQVKTLVTHELAETIQKQTEPSAEHEFSENQEQTEPSVEHEFSENQVQTEPSVEHEFSENQEQTEDIVESELPENLAQGNSSPSKELPNNLDITDFSDSNCNPVLQQDPKKRTQLWKMVTSITDYIQSELVSSVLRQSTKKTRGVVTRQMQFFGVIRVINSHEPAINNLAIFLRQPATSSLLAGNVVEFTAINIFENNILLANNVKKVKHVSARKPCLSSTCSHGQLTLGGTYSGVVVKLLPPYAAVVRHTLITGPVTDVFLFCLSFEPVQGMGCLTYLDQITSYLDLGDQVLFTPERANSFGGLHAYEWRAAAATILAKASLRRAQGVSEPAHFDLASDVHQSARKPRLSSTWSDGELVQGGTYSGVVVKLLPPSAAVVQHTAATGLITDVFLFCHHFEPVKGRGCLTYLDQITSYLDLGDQVLFTPERSKAKGPHAYEWRAVAATTQTKASLKITEGQQDRGVSEPVHFDLATAVERTLRSQHPAQDVALALDSHIVNNYDLEDVVGYFYRLYNVAPPAAVSRKKEDTQTQTLSTGNVVYGRIFTS